ncbi:MAG: ribosome small subunit-dependent GTPase A, partial [Candidatus Sericytochromatia bacterium]|nr:ribosome small subunit-dependent GTPase A [Candidatus Tanganyikabacteria bacterium]
MSGRLAALAAGDPVCRPVVGDWVAHTPGGGSGAVVIRDVLPRQTVFSRKAATAVTAVQVVAANLTTLFLVVSADAGFNLRRLERYLVQAVESGAAPVVVLNKADLARDMDTLLAQLREVAPGFPIHAVSATHGDGLTGLAPYLGPGQTVALLGSSGVGKSTLVNAIAGADLRRTAAVREDDRRGRHTTTDRRLLRLPAGALLLDTPGMRELALWADADTVDEAFPDIVALSAGCRFTDCAHGAEPGCAVKGAVEAGSLPPRRLQSYRKLAAEAARLALRRAARPGQGPGGPPAPAG